MGELPLRLPVVPGLVVEEVVGRGGFATVFRARQPDLERAVALKVMHPAVQADEGALRRFQQECRAIGSLTGHPGVVTVFEVGVTADRDPYLVMEYLSGGSLQQRLAGVGPRPWPEVVAAGVAIADALAAAHELGIVHRDVKPANVLLDRFGNHKLGDFGIAALASSTGSATVGTAATVAYAAPEVLLGERADARSDLYGLGATLYALLSGRPASWRETDESILPAMLRITTAPVDPLPEEVAPEALRSLIAELMALDPFDRPLSAEQVRDRLSQAGTDRPDPPFAGTAEAPSPIATAGDVSTLATPGSGDAVTHREATLLRAPGWNPLDPPTAAPQRAVQAGAATVEAAAGRSLDGVVRDEPPGPPGRAHRGSRVALLVIGLAAVASIAVLAIRQVGGASNSAEPRASRVIWSTPVGGVPNGVAAGGGGLWVGVERAGQQAGGRLVAVDRDGTIRHEVPIRSRPGALRVVGSTLWVTDGAGGRLVAVDARTGDGSRAISVGGRPADVVGWRGQIWYSDFSTGQVGSVSAEGRVGPRIKACSQAQGLAVAEGALWVACPGDGKVVRVSPTGAVRSITIGGTPVSLAGAGDTVWVTDNSGRQVVEVAASDPPTRSGAVAVGGDAWWVAGGPTGLWVTRSRGGGVVGLDPVTGRRISETDFGASSGGVAVFGDGRVAVADRTGQRLVAVSAGG